MAGAAGGGAAGTGSAAAAGAGAGTGASAAGGAAATGAGAAGAEAGASAGGGCRQPATPASRTARMAAPESPGTRRWKGVWRGCREEACLGFANMGLSVNARPARRERASRRSVARQRKRREAEAVAHDHGNADRLPGLRIRTGHRLGTRLPPGQGIRTGAANVEVCRRKGGKARPVVPGQCHFFHRLSPGRVGPPSGRAGGARWPLKGRDGGTGGKY